MEPTIEKILSTGGNTRAIKWLLALSVGIFILAFEFLRHALMLDIHMEWGNLLVAGFSSLLFLVYFSFIFSVIERLSDRMTEEKTGAAILREREKIARRLHDSLAQSLFFLNIKAQGVEKFLRSRGIDCPQLPELQEAIRHMDGDIRNNIYLLKELQTQGQGPLRQVIENSAKQLLTGYEVQLVVDIEDSVDKTIPSTIRYAVIRMVHELFMNIRKHANADRVLVNMVATKAQLMLRIEDNGRGFGQDCLARPDSFGLRGMQGDVEAVGGRMYVSNGPGAIVTIKLPGKL